MGAQRPVADSGHSHPPTGKLGYEDQRPETRLLRHVMTLNSLGIHLRLVYHLTRHLATGENSMMCPKFLTLKFLKIFLILNTDSLPLLDFLSMTNSVQNLLA